MKGPVPLSDKVRVVSFGAPESVQLATPGSTIEVPIIVSDISDILSLHLFAYLPPDMIEGYEIVAGPSQKPDWQLTKRTNQSDQFELDLWAPTPLGLNTCWALNLKLKISANMEVGDRIALSMTGFANEHKAPLLFVPSTIQII